MKWSSYFSNLWSVQDRTTEFLSPFFIGEKLMEGQEIECCGCGDGSFILKKETGNLKLRCAGCDAFVAFVVPRRGKVVVRV